MEQEQDIQAIRQQALEQAGNFIIGNQLLIQSLTGIRGVNIKVGPGFATSMENGDVTVDPSFFIEQDYKPEWCTYGLMHELAAHLRGMVLDPKHAEEVTEFYKQGQEYAVFANIFEDIAGNRRMHQLLPTMADVAKDVYENKLFEEADLTKEPRHLQFLYGLIRESMIGEGDTVISDEVMYAMDELRNYGHIKKEDALEYVCNPNIPEKKRWKILQKVVWPVYERLLEKDIQDRDEQKKSEQNNQNNQGKQGNQSDSGQSQGQNQEGESGQNQSGESQNNSEVEQQNSGQSSGAGQEGDQQEQQNGGGGGGSDGEHKHSHGRGDVDKSKAGDEFSENYEDYWNSHPEVLTEEQHKEVEEFIKDQIENGNATVDPEQDESKEQSDSNQNDKSKGGSSEKGGVPPSQEVIRALEITAGAPYEVIQAYRRDLDRLWPLIENIEEFYEQIISDRLTIDTKTKRYQDEGTINPDQMVDAYMAIRSGRDEGAVYQETEISTERVPDSGGFDFYLGIDVSGSMGGQKSVVATESAVVLVEGLASCHQKVIEAQKEHGIELGLDVATSVLVFGEGAETLKPNGEMLDESERMHIYQRAQNADGRATEDYLALETILEEVREKTDIESKRRKKIVVMVTDGGSSNSTRARKVVEELRQEGVVVIGVGIDSSAATSLYAPTGKQINGVTDLPDTLVDIVKDQIRQGILERKS